MPATKSLTTNKAPKPATATTPSKAPFDALVSQHGAVVLRMCRALVGSQEADDVWQETFLTALRAYPTTTVENAQAWLVTLARNKSIDHLRKAGRLPTPTTDLALGDAHHGAGDGTLVARLGEVGDDVVLEAVLAARNAEVVWAALSELGTKQRQAVVYHHLAGLPFSEVAGLLGNSVEAARRASSDGLKALRTLLDPANPRRMR